MTPQTELKKTKVQVLAAFKELFNPEWRTLVYYGGRASGKSHAVAQALILRGRKDKLRILCTREVQNTIKDSVHKLLSDLIEKYEFTDYEVQRDTIFNRVTGSEFIFKGLKHNINEIKSTEGIDICWIEEGQSITEASLDILTPTIRKAGSQIIVTFNRFNELDPVYVRYVLRQQPKTYVAQVNFDVLERAGLLPDVIKTEMAADIDNRSLYAHKWLGEPLSQSDRAILSRDNILDAMNREIEDDGAFIYGVDVARMGDDRTVFWQRKGLKSTDYKIFSKLRTPEICDRLEQFVSFDKTALVKIDDTGVGGGVTDEMMKRGYNIEPVNFGGVAADKDKYPNWISEAWFNMAELLPQIQLPMNSDLLMELSTRNWTQDVKGKRRVEGKNEYKKRGFRSPDIADACIIAYHSGKSLTLDDIAL